MKRNSEGLFHLFRIGDAVAARKTHAAIYDGFACQNVSSGTGGSKESVQRQGVRCLNDNLHKFLDAAFIAFNWDVTNEAYRKSINQIFNHLEEPDASYVGKGSRLPGCSFLDQSLSIEVPRPELVDLLAAFKLIKPGIRWAQRTVSDGSASPNSVDRHARAMIFGPGGIKKWDDVWVGASILMPHVRYPDHSHPPEETYLVVSEGEFMQEDKDWFTPGIGGHAIRTTDVPLSAF